MKRAVFLIVTLLMLLMLVGCGANEDSSNVDTTFITDSLGREVEVPTEIDRIVPLGNTPRMIKYLGLSDKAVGIGSMDSDNITPVTAYAYANREMWKELPIVGTDVGGATDCYSEQIVSVSPEVIFCTYNEEIADELQMKTGVPVVVVPMGTLFEKDYEEALLLIGSICGVEERANIIIEYLNDNLNELIERTSNISNENKPSVLGAAATYKGIHGIDSIYSNYPVFEVISANDVAMGISDAVNRVTVDKEIILEWDPEYIMLDSGGVNLVKFDFEENPGYYEELSAFKNGNIYQYPSSTSYYTNVEISLVNSYYVASLLYPEEFKDIEFDDKANEIFKFFLGNDNYLKELENYGSGYCKVNIGEK
ncbi:MAG TPA: ABC transporter substrate-binding protein [Anaerovoracaceae bacterium]|nr:ABC transporter substrate-binding protein [Anaerovoracaceae bacterium]